MFPRCLVNFAIVVLRAEKLHIAGDTSPKKSSAGVAGDSSIVNMVVGHIPTHVTGDFPDEFGPFSFRASGVAGGTFGGRSGRGQGRGGLLFGFGGLVARNEPWVSDSPRRYHFLKILL